MVVEFGSQSEQDYIVDQTQNDFAAKKPQKRQPIRQS